MPMSTVCSGCTFGEKPPIRDSSAGSGPSSDASGMPCTLPLRRARRRVHVAVRVDPDEAERLLLATHEIRRRRDRPGREAVIATEDERQTALFERRQRRLVEPLADFRDLADVLLVRVAERLDLGDRRDEVALVDDGDAERGQALAEPGDAERGRAHVDAAAVAAEIQRDTDDVDGRAGTDGRL